MFYLLSKLEYEKIKSVINICSSRSKSFANTRVDDLHVYMKSLRGYASYWNTAKSDLLAMIRQLGSPSWFITLSANDSNWPDLIKDLLYAKHCSDNNSAQFIFNVENVANMTYKEKAQLLHDFPVIAARHFDHRFRKLLSFLLNDEEILGKCLVKILRKESLLNVEFDEDDFCSDIFDKYSNRSVMLENLCLHEFSSN